MNAREKAHELINKWQRIHEEPDIRGFFDLRDFVAEALNEARREAIEECAKYMDQFSGGKAAARNLCALAEESK